MPASLCQRLDPKPLLFLVVVSWWVVTAAQADATVAAPVRLKPVHQLNQEQETLLSACAVKVLRGIADVRRRLKTPAVGMRQAAIRRLAEVGRLLDLIQAGLVGHPTTPPQPGMPGTPEWAPDLVPIYAALTESADAGLFYVEADLPLDTTLQLVGQAREALARGATPAADRALGAAEQGVEFVSMVIDSPLIDARNALFKAWQSYRRGDRDRVARQLQAAIGHLKVCADGKDPVTRANAARLLDSLRGIAIAAGPDNALSAQRLKNAWQRVRAMAERATESISTGWQRYHPQDYGKKELIEAKLLLEFARIDHQENGGDTDARSELAKALGYLASAAGKMPSADGAEIKPLLSDVDGLRKAWEPGAPARGDELAFERAETTLGRLIHRL